MRPPAWFLLGFATLLTASRWRERFGGGQVSNGRPHCPECSRPLTNHGPGTYVCVTCRFRTRSLNS